MKQLHTSNELILSSASRRTFGLNVFAFLAAVSTATVGAAEPNVPFEVCATVGMIGDIVQNIAGERAQVNAIIGEGVDPHLYKPTTSDIKALSRADVVFYNGLMLA